MPAKKDPDADARFAEVVEQLSSGYKTIGQMAYGILREAILSGALAPGEWLRQESLAEMMGVSRLPVRTALKQLESEGLVSFHPHRGARVRTFSAAQIDEIYRLRRLLETYALRLSMANMRPERLDTLRKLSAQLDEKPAGTDFIEARVRFYREVYDAERNPLTVEMIEDLRGRRRPLPAALPLRRARAHPLTASRSHRRGRPHRRGAVAVPPSGEGPGRSAPDAR